MACTFLQFIFIVPSSAEGIKIRFYRSTETSWYLCAVLNTSMDQ